MHLDVLLRTVSGQFQEGHQPLGGLRGTWTPTLQISSPAPHPIWPSGSPTHRVPQCHAQRSLRAPRCQGTPVSSCTHHQPPSPTRQCPPEASPGQEGQAPSLVLGYRRARTRRACGSRAPRPLRCAPAPAPALSSLLLLLLLPSLPPPLPPSTLRAAAEAERAASPAAAGAERGEHSATALVYRRGSRLVPPDRPPCAGLSVLVEDRGPPGASRPPAATAPL